MVRLDWHSGYEWEIPNALDREFERRFRNCLKGVAAKVILRSPWLHEDLASLPGIFTDAITIGCNLSIQSFPAHYCVSGGDPGWWANCNPEDYPGTVFILPGCQDALRRLSEHDYSNVYLYTSPPELPTGQQKHQRHLPRPYKNGLTGYVALWLAWYIGCSPVYLAGCDFALREGVIHGDQPHPADLTPETKALYLDSFTYGRLDLTGLVEAMRLSGSLVNWPGERVRK
jgi:hypothetical protein